MGKTDRYTMQKELGYRIYLVGIGNSTRPRDYGGEKRRGGREGGTEKEKRERRVRGREEAERQ